MPENTTLKIIRPKDMGPVFEEVEKEIAKQMKEEVKIGQRMFQRTTQSWRNRVRFNWEWHKRGVPLKTGYHQWAKTYAENRIYYFINHGTRIRWAVMSRDFDPKTVRRQIQSYTGQGGAVIVGRKAMQARGIPPRPGIEGREFDVEIQERRQKIFPIKIMAAIKRGVERGNKKVVRMNRLNRSL